MVFPHTEDDLLDIVANYFHEIGFDRSEFRFEKQYSLKLGHHLLSNKKSTSKTKSISARSDLLLTRNGRNLAIVETKAPRNPLTPEDAKQAISYARLLPAIAPYAIVTNGGDTRVYDVLQDYSLPIPINSPSDSLWIQRGQTMEGISEDLRDEAASRIIGVNDSTLRDFCISVSKANLDVLSGSIDKHKIYVEELYVERIVTDESFSKWLSTDNEPCFALIGESGQGKTNFMCSRAKDLQEDYFTLFYSANNLIDNSLVKTICNDFEWEFRRDRHIPYVVDRFNDIAQRHDKKIIIFLDGIDEFTGERSMLKNEINDLARRFRNCSIKLCVSCKDFDWSEFVIEREQYLTSLGEIVYSPRHADTVSPDSKNIGIWITDFTEQELTTAFKKYKDTFVLLGDLSGTTRDECHFPLMLRLISEAYRNEAREIPSEISNEKVFEIYWARRLGNIRREHIITVGLLLDKLAEICIDENVHQVHQSILIKSFSPWPVHEPAYEAMIRAGLVRLSSQEMLSFTFEKIRSYIYTVKTKRWPNSPPSEVAKQIAQIIKTSVGAEAVEFYFTTIDLGGSSLLSIIAAQDDKLFFKLIFSLKMESTTARGTAIEHQSRKYKQRFEQYGVVYTQFLDKYFKSLRSQIPPYAPAGNIGVWTSEDFWVYQMRGCTKKYPDWVVTLPDDVVKQLWSGERVEELYDELKPGGLAHSIHHDLIMHFPQRVAWHELQKSVGQIFKNRTLDESTAIGISADRIWRILLQRPYAWFDNDPHAGKNFLKTLGYISPDELVNEPLQEFKNRVAHIHNFYVRSLTTPLASNAFAKRCIYHRIEWLLSVYQSLEQIEKSTSSLPPALIPPEIFKPVVGNKQRYEQASYLKNWITLAIENYKLLAKLNFPDICDELVFLKYPHAPVIIEFYNNGSEVPKLRIAVMVNEVFQEQQYFVIVNPSENRLLLQLEAEHLQNIKVLREFGLTRLNKKIAEDQVFSGNGYVYFSELSYNRSVLDQAYQLLGHEIAYLIKGVSSDWQIERPASLSNDIDIKRYF